MWKIKHIFDGDYGCEALAPGEKPKVSVTLVNEVGEEKIESVEDEWLTVNNLDVGSDWPETDVSKHVKCAMALRQSPMCPNCAETIMMAFAQDLGLSEEQARSLGTNFGGGMKCGSVCGAVTSALMVLGALGVTSPTAAAGLQRQVKENHGGLINCADLLNENAVAGGQKKPHCDAMIKEAIELIEEYAER